MINFPQGHGVAGRYGGLPDEWATLANSKIAVLPVAFDQTTTYRHGAEKGPTALIEASRHMELYDIETDLEVYTHGICTLPGLQPLSSIEMQESVYTQVKHLLQQKKFVVTIGGEHSISFAPIRAHAEHFSSLSVLQFDAHADLQETYEGNPWSHACVMARVLELSQLNKIVAVGIRSLSREELVNLNRIHAFFCHDLFHSNQWMQKVLENLSSHVYITIDLDVFDSALMPSTGTPEPGGLYWPHVTELLKLVAQHKNIVGFDIMELCPNPTNPAPDFLAAKLLYKLLSYKFKFYEDT